MDAEPEQSWNIYVKNKLDHDSRKQAIIYF